MPPCRDILGVFPSSSSIGGVQASGREAWNGILDHVGSENAHRFCYSPGTSKIRAITKAMRSRCESDTVLVWHLDLLKLLPFLGAKGRVIVYLHGIEAWREQDRLTKRALRGVNLVLTNSFYTWERFLKFNPGLRTTPYRAVALGIGRPVTCATTVGPYSSPIVLMVGRMQKAEDYKGHREMIEAWHLVLQHVPDAQLWIVGDGDLRPELEQLVVSRKLAGSIRFWGPVSDADKERMLLACRCLALPSRAEGFGLVYLEAMRAGRPCLVSNLDAGREVVNPPEAGLAVDPTEMFEIAHATSRLLTPGSEWSQWSDNARRRYEAHFTAEQFQRRLVDAVFGANPDLLCP